MRAAGVASQVPNTTIYNQLKTKEINNGRTIWQDLNHSFNAQLFSFDREYGGHTLGEKLQTSS